MLKGKTDEGSEPFFGGISGRLGPEVGVCKVCETANRGANPTARFAARLGPKRYGMLT